MALVHSLVRLFGAPVLCVCTTSLIVSVAALYTYIRFTCPPPRGGREAHLSFVFVCSVLIFLKIRWISCAFRDVRLSRADVASGRTFGMLSPPLHNEGPPHILHRRLIASPKLNSRIVLYCHHFPVALTAIWSHRRLRFRNGWSASPVHCGVSLFSPVSVSVSVLECAFCLLLGLPC